MDATPLCALCSSTAELACPDCHALLYCSAACATADAAVHKLICADFASPPLRPTGDGKYALGILFPAGLQVPSPAWVPISGFVDEDTSISFQEAHVGSFFNRTDDAAVVPEALHSERNRVRNRDSRSMLEVWNMATTTQAENECIRQLGRHRDGPHHPWKGAVLVLAMTRPTGFMVDPGAYQDCQLRDLYDAVDFVLDYGDDVHARRIRDALDSLGTASHAEVSTCEAAADVVQEKSMPGSSMVVEMEG